MLLATFLALAPALPGFAPSGPAPSGSASRSFGSSSALAVVHPAIAFGPRRSTTTSARSMARQRRVLEAAVERRSRFLERIDLWEDHSSWDDPWIVTTDHYEVRTTDSFGLARRVADGLETMHGHFRDLLGGEVSGPPQPVWILPTMGGYNTFGDDIGDDHSSILGAFYATGHPEQPLLTYFIPNETQLMMWLTHAATHQYLASAFRREPQPFLAEGLASYFSLFWDWRYGAREHQRLKRENGFRPLETLMNDDVPAYRDAPHDRFIQLGMLFNYLLHYCEPTRRGAEGEEPEASFANYLRAAVRGQDLSEQGFAFFLEVPDAIDQDMRAFDFPE